MAEFTAPLKDILFAMKHSAGYDDIAGLPGLEEAGWDIAEAVVGEAGRIAEELLAPLNRSGDREGAWIENGVVRTASGWREAFQRLAADGWYGLSARPDHGGQGLPEVIGTAVSELFQSANMSFALCGMLTNGAVRAIDLNGSPEQKSFYIPKLASGQWTGTMNLTEPQAGSDLAALRTMARREGDHYRIRGQKIFITYGDHDLTENIVHLVLARTPDAPPGVKGISLFIVPKFLSDGEGSIGARNDVRCLSLEHKLGIHASPTAVMSFGEEEGAVGYLVGEENRGLEYMFVMMNQARFEVGVEGLAIAERAYQQALAYARERIQGKPLGGRRGDPIIAHPDVKRMLLSMKARIDAMRGLCHACAGFADIAERDSDGRSRAGHRALVELLTPIVKGWCTETGIEIASLGIQVHGGLGYIEETGAAQHYRDARIASIYEGTTGIQANDLVFRKVLRDRGAALEALLAAMRESRTVLAERGEAVLGETGEGLQRGIEALERAGAHLIRAGEREVAEVAAVAEPFLRLAGTVAGGWQIARLALAASEESAGVDVTPAFLAGKVALARFYMAHVMPQASALADVVEGGAGAVLEFADGGFGEPL